MGLERYWIVIETAGVHRGNQKNDGVGYTQEERESNQKRRKCAGESKRERGTPAAQGEV